MREQTITRLVLPTSSTGACRSRRRALLHFGGSRRALRGALEAEPLMFASNADMPGAAGEESLDRAREDGGMLGPALGSTPTSVDATLHR